MRGEKKERERERDGGLCSGEYIYIYINILQLFGYEISCKCELYLIQLMTDTLHV